MNIRKLDENIIIQMIFKDMFLQRTVIEYIPLNFFTNPDIKYIYSKLLLYTKKYKQPILKNDFIYLLKDDEKIVIINKYLNSNKIIDNELFLKLLTIDIKNYKLEILKNKIKNSTVNTAEIEKLTKEINNLNLNDIIEFVDFKDVKTVIKLEKEQRDGSFLTGYPQIDMFVKSNGGFTKGSFTTFIAPPHTGKCVVPSTKIISNYLNFNENKEITKEITILELYKKGKIDKIKNDKKFISKSKIDNYYVWTNTGFKKVEYVLKTVPYEIYKLITDSGKYLECADDHLVATLRGLKTIKEIEVGVDTVITDKLYELVISVEKTNKKVNMYDIQLSEEIEKFEINKNSDFKNLKIGDYLKNSDNNYEFFEVKDINNNDIFINSNSHLYFTNGILSHNTLLLTNIAAKAVKRNKKVLYLSFEMPENEILKRVYVNLFDSKMNTINKELHKIETIINEIGDTLGELKTKEYPSSTCTPTMIEILLTKLQKRKEIDKNAFFPDILIVDQLTTMGTDKSISGLYEKGKEGIERLKAIGQKFKIIIFSAAQGNREAGKKEDKLKMDNVAESWGIPQISDMCFGLLVNESSIDEKKPDYYELNVNCFKNRLTGLLKTTIWGVNKQKMALVEKEF